MDPFSFGLNLYIQFNAAYVHCRAGRRQDKEEYYFRALIHAFMSTKGSFAKEVHGRGHIVEFVPTGKWKNRCEIADIALVSFTSKPKVEIRLSFIQAKLIRGVFDDQKLEAAMHQWDLLHNRPLLTRLIGKKAQGFPKDILKNALLPSIGAYLFFSDIKHQRALYMPAQLLNKNKNYSTNYGKLRATATGALVKPIKGHNEISRTDCICTFGAATKLMFVGSPIVGNGVVLSPSALHFTKNIINLANVEEGNNVLGEILDTISGLDYEPPNSTPQRIGVRALIVIKGATEDGFS